MDLEGKEHNHIVPTRNIEKSIYEPIGRLIWWVTPSSYPGFSTFWVPARWITPLFVTFDLGSFYIQFLGLAAVTADFEARRRGGKIF